MKKIAIILLFLILPSMAFATFTIQLNNTSDKKIFYMLYWIDHPYDWPFPFNVAGGELEARQTIDLKARYQNGRYFVVWSDKDEWQNRVMMNVDLDIISVTVTPVDSKMRK